MAWVERDSTGYYFICLRVGAKRFKRSLDTKSEREASLSKARLEENLLLVERGRLEIPASADLVTFLLSDGRVAGKLEVPESLTLRQLFKQYFAAVPEGGLEQTTIDGMKIHQKHLERHFGHAFPIRTLKLQDLQEYIQKRSRQKGLHGKVTACTIKKGIVTLRTVWNWGVTAKLVEGAFPAAGLKYPKTKEKSPFMSLAEVIECTRGMNDAEAAEIWECVYLTLRETQELLSYVKQNARHDWIYPLFVFAAYTGARRSEIARCRVRDVNLRAGWVTIHERKRSHEKLTTRRVPVSTKLHTVLRDWLAKHPGGNALFCHSVHVPHSKKRSLTTGYAWKNRPTLLKDRLATVRHRPTISLSPLTQDEMHDHFKRTLKGSKWEQLRGWHSLRHSFVSSLASNNVDQRLIEEWCGHMDEATSRRYRHLYPTTQQETFRSVFSAAG